MRDAGLSTRFEAPSNHSLALVARLRPGLTIASARPGLAGLARRLTDLQPAGPNRERDLEIQPPSRIGLSTSPNPEMALDLVSVLVLAMAAVVLLIASLNLANMLLARGTARTREIAIRLAIGASRARVVRQLLCEGFLLALVGGAAGLLISLWSNDLLLHSLAALFTSMHFSLAVQLGPDPLVLAVTLGLCVLATLVFGLGPALQATKGDLVRGLKQHTGEPAHGLRLQRFFGARHLLIMAQMALSLVLLFAGGLFLRGALNAGQAPLGFDPAGGLVAELDLNLGSYDPARGTRTLFAALERARQLPGVRSAGFGSLLPYANVNDSRRVAPAQPSFSGAGGLDRSASGFFTAASPGYFDAIGLRLLRGRDFTAHEAQHADSPAVAILDEHLAAALFPDSDALGKRIRYTQPDDKSPAELEVVGIVSTHRQDVMFDNEQRHLYVPLAQDYNGNVFLHVRLDTSDRRIVLAALPTLRQALRGVDPQLPVVGLAPFVDLVENNAGLWIVRLGAVLFGIFGAVALLLAVVGVYAVKSYTVARRTQEIGIRIALGARPADVLSLVLKQGAQQTALALGVGLLLALSAGQILARILYQVSPADPLALLAAAAVLSAASLLACFLPARRATRVSPMSALRSE